MFLRFLFLVSFTASFAQTPTTLCEEKWDNGTSKCGPVFYSGADLLSDNLYVGRRYDVARIDSLVYDIGTISFQDFDSVVTEMDFGLYSSALSPYYDTLTDGFVNNFKIISYLGYLYSRGETDLSCSWKVKFNSKMTLLPNGRIKTVIPFNKLKQKNTILYFSLSRAYGFMAYSNTQTNKYSTFLCPNGQTERQLYNCMCEKDPDPVKCKLAYFTPTNPYSFNLTIDNFVAVGYKSGVITSVEQQNDGLISTKQVVARYDVMGRQIEENSTYSGVLILVYSDGTRQKVFVQ